MRIPSHHDRESGRSDATMTPMIDVVFLLLIFFICTASFQIAEQILPSHVRIEAGAGAVDVKLKHELEDLQPVVVKVFLADGRPAWNISGRSVTSLADVRRTLEGAAAVDTRLPVIVSVAGEVPLGHAIDVYDAARTAGFNTIQFAATLE